MGLTIRQKMWCCLSLSAACAAAAISVGGFNHAVAPDWKTFGVLRDFLIAGWGFAVRSSFNK